MDVITLKDFEIVACHGANPEEKTDAQRFLVTANAAVNVEDAARSDDIDKTVSYSAIKKMLKSFFENNCFDLIETLAVRSAYLLLKSFNAISSVEITVKKPDAPMSGVFDYVAVSVARAWHRVYLALGSNMGDRNAYLDFAINKLRSDDNFKNVRESKRYCTDPYGNVAKFEFVNSAAECDTLYSPKELLGVLRDIEAQAGRVRKEHWGDRTLDIDVIFYDDDVIQEDSLCVPHIDMQNREFVLRPLYELCPYKVHPLFNKRVEEMLRDLPSPCGDI